MADAEGIGCGVGRLSVTMLDQLVMLLTQEPKLRHAAIAIEHAELDALVANEDSTVGAALDMHTGPGVELIGDLIDERIRMGHGPGS